MRLPIDQVPPKRVVKICSRLNFSHIDKYSIVRSRFSYERSTVQVDLDRRWSIGGNIKVQNII